MSLKHEGSPRRSGRFKLIARRALAISLAAGVALAIGIGGDARDRKLLRGLFPQSIAPRQQFDAFVTTAQAERSRCMRERARVAALPALPGTPKLEQNRALVLGHAKADPVIFVREPKLLPNDSPIVRKYRRTMEIAQFPWDVLRWLSSRFWHHPEHGREALLREGYLYADSPELAFALVDQISAHHLFNSDTIWIERGGFTRHATRTKSGKYVYSDGPEKGQGVRLLLFDRIGTGPIPKPLHRDLRTLRYQLQFDRVKIERLTEDRILASLRYGSTWVPSVLSSEGSRVQLECELVPERHAAEVEEVRRQGERKERVLRKLRRAMIAQIEDGLPFDEPITEHGQQDGQMRYQWMRAYLSGQRSYRMNGDLYYVYGPDGQPRPPQVCIDFVWDTFERASGTWWEKLGEEPRRVVGRMDFGTFADSTLRRADKLVEFARMSKERFKVHVVPPNQRYEMWRKQEFFGYLTHNAEHFEPGDIVMIRGYTSFEKRWQRKVMHYHSFFVYEVDPLSGVPVALVGNPGRPSIRTWLFEGLRTPKRSVWYSIRPRLEWLEGIIAPDVESPLEPPTLSAEPS